MIPATRPRVAITENHQTMNICDRFHNFVRSSAGIFVVIFILYYHDTNIYKSNIQRENFGLPRR